MTVTESVLVVPDAEDKPRRRRSRVWWWLLAVVLVAGGVFAVTRIPAGSVDPAQSVRAAHGPTSVVDGVPVGYTRDDAGAVTAGVNLVQALTAAGRGDLTVDAVRAARVVEHPGPGLVSQLDSMRSRQSESVLNVLPALAGVTEFSDDKAHVVMWGMAVSDGRLDAGDPMSVMQLYGTTEVDLAWVDGDWRATDLVGVSGPAPSELVQPRPDSVWTKMRPMSGYYTTYVN
jgi:hypothetical protein